MERYDEFRRLKSGDLLLHVQSLVLGHFVKLYEPGEFVDFNGSHLSVPAIEVAGGHVFGIYEADSFVLLPSRAKHVLNAVYMSFDYALSELRNLILVLGLSDHQVNLVIKSILKTIFDRMG